MKLSFGPRFSNQRAKHNNTIQSIASTKFFDLCCVSHATNLKRSTQIIHSEKCETFQRLLNPTTEYVSCEKNVSRILQMYVSAKRNMYVRTLEFVYFCKILIHIYFHMANNTRCNRPFRFATPTRSQALLVLVKWF